MDKVGGAGHKARHFDAPDGLLSGFVFAALRSYAGLAQMVEQLFCKHQVTGSIPVAGTSFLDVSAERCRGVVETRKRTGSDFERNG